MEVSGRNDNLLPPPDLVTGIILAGGQSHRLGQDKGFVLLHGKTLAERAVEVLRPFCSNILFSANDPAYRQFSFPVIGDAVPGKGPMMGLYSALRASETKQNLVLAVDNFLVKQDFFGFVLGKKVQDADVAIPFLAGRYFEPLVGYYDQSVIQEMESMMKSGNFKLPDLFAQIRILKLDVQQDFPGYHPDYFRSLNTPEDLVFMQTAG
jgi:molybdopterin-guanine dinucleotide biosynthesis protein A